MQAFPWQDIVIVLQADEDISQKTCFPFEHTIIRFVLRICLEDMSSRHASDMLKIAKKIKVICKHYGSISLKISNIMFANHSLCV